MDYIDYKIRIKTNWRDDKEVPFLLEIKAVNFEDAIVKANRYIMDKFGGLGMIVSIDEEFPKKNTMTIEEWLKK